MAKKEPETLNYKGCSCVYRRCGTAIVGSGAAGFAAANRLMDTGYNDILMVTEGVNMGTSRNTGSDKQTYYKLNLCGNTQDSPRGMAQTLFDGESMDGDLALCEAANSARCFYYLCEAGVPFPFNEAGEYAGYKTDHDPAMRATSAGPLTSKFMTECLQKKAAARDLEILDGWQAVELAVKDGSCCGLTAMNRKTGAWLLIQAGNVIFATGGPSGIYDAVVYPASQTGSTGIALRAGARAKNLMEWQYGITSTKFRWNCSGSYEQVLPRYVSTAQDGSDVREFLRDYFENVGQMLSAQFLKGYQWPFDPRKTLIENGGSSILDIAVYNEIVNKNRRVWIDYMHNPTGLEVTGENAFAALDETAYTYLKNSGCLLPLPIDRLEQMNPNAVDLYRSHGIDLHTEMLEVAVSAQHNNGGIAGDMWWESEIPHLFVIGEVNGSHGVFRPGGCALNSGQVGALRASQRITTAYRKTSELSREEFLKTAYSLLDGSLDFTSKLARGHGRKPAEITAELRRLMSADCAHMRSAAKTQEALVRLKELEADAENGCCADCAPQIAEAFKLRDAIITSRALAQSIDAYIKYGGGSRGSYLIEGTENDNGALAGKILEVSLKDGGPECSWRDVRPIPQPEEWFENVWRNYKQLYQN